MIFPDGMRPATCQYVEEAMEVPENALVIGVVSVVAWSDPDNGQMRWSAHYLVEAPVSTTIGLLEMAKLEILAQSPGVITNLSFDEHGELDE